MTVGLDPTGIESHPDEFHRGQSWKRYCRVATTANITIATALNAGDTIDGVVLVAGDRILVKDQTTGSQNGIYVAGATPIRDFDLDQDLASDTPQDEVLGAMIKVIAGTVNGGKVFQSTNTTAPTLGTTALVFTEFAPSSNLTIKDEGSALATAAASIDFVGAGVTATGTGAAKTVTIPGGASALDDLTDVVIATPATADRLRYDGSVWRNSALIWKPVMDGSGNVVTDSGTGDAIMTEVIP